MFCVFIVFGIHAGATRDHGIVLAPQSHGVREIAFKADLFKTW